MSGLSFILAANGTPGVGRWIPEEIVHALLGRSHLISGQYRVRIEAPDVSICAVGNVVPVITTPSLAQINGIKLSRRETIAGILRSHPELVPKLAVGKSGNFSTRNQHLICAAGRTSIAGTKGRVRNKPWFGACCSCRNWRRFGNSFHPDVCGLYPKSPGKVRILSGLHIHCDTPIPNVDVDVHVSRRYGLAQNGVV